MGRLRKSVGLLLGLMWFGFAGSCLADERPIYAPAPAWVSEAPPPNRSTVRSDEPIEILFRDRHVRIGGDAVSAYSRQVIQINSATGLQIAGNVAFGWNPALETLTIHYFVIRRNGEVIDLLRGGAAVSILRREQNLDYAMLDGALTASVQPPGLQVGDVLDLAATIERRDPTLRGHAETAAELIDAPAQRVRFRADWPKELNVRWRAAPGVPAARPFTSADRAGVAFDARDVEPLNIAQGAPRRFYETGYLEFSDHPSFASVSALLTPLFEAAATLSPNSPLAAEIDRIRASSNDPRRRALAALRLVQEQVRYFFVGLGNAGYTPAGADETWTRRFGDCKGKTALLLALLRGLGIEAEPALVSAARNDGLEARLPMLQSFDHVLVRAVIDGRVYWIDGTRLGDRNLEDAGGLGLRWALPLRADGADLEQLPSHPPTAPYALTNIEVDASAGLHAPAPARGEMRLRVGAAMALRMAFGSLRPDQREPFARNLWGAQHGWIDVESATIAFDDESGDALLSVRGKVALNAREGAASANFAVFPARFEAAALYHRDDANTDNPVAVAFPYFAQTTIRIRLPHGGAGFRVDADEIDRRIGAMRLRRRSVIRDGAAEIEVSTQTSAPEMTASEARAADTEFSALSAQFVHVQSARYVYTEQDLQAAATRNSEDGGGRLNRAIALLNRGDYTAAKADLDAILADDPNSEWALANRGMVLLHQEDADAAEADFARALALNPGVYVAYHGRGMLLFRRNEFAGAVEALSTALRLQPSDLFARGIRAVSYAKLGDNTSALADYRVLVAEAPQDPLFRVGLAKVLVDLGQDAEARETVRALAEGVAEGSSEWEDALMLRSRIAAELGWFDRAIEDADALVRRSAAKVPTLVHRCRVLASANRNLDQALRDCNAALALDRRYAEGFSSRALVRLRRGEFDLAIRDYGQALRIDSGLAEARYGRGLALLRNGERVRADADFAAARAISPDVEGYFTRLSLAPANAPAGQDSTQGRDEED